MSDNPIPNTPDTDTAARLLPSGRSLNRTQVNQIIRIGLIGVLVATVAFVILAAHPAPRVFGFYPGTLNGRNALYGDGDGVVAYVTLSNVAIVTFPASWKLTDSLCATVQLERTAVASQLDFNDYVPQRHWDDPENNILTSGYHMIDAKSDTGDMVLHQSNNDMALFVSEQTPYRVQWFGQDPVQILPDQNVGGLMCFNFQYVDGKPMAHLPPFFYVAVGVINGHVYREPAFYFNNHDSVPDSNHPAQTSDLVAAPVPINDYLTGLLLDAPFAVQLQQSP